MKSNINCLSIILIAASMGMAELANAFYDPGLQRWINRDPLGDTASLPLMMDSSVPGVESGGITGRENSADFFDAWVDVNRNSYGAMRNNLVSISDPFGLSPSLNPANQAAAGECIESAGAVGGRSLAQREALKKAAQGAKRYSEWLEHTKKLKEAEEKLAKLKKLLDKTKGPKAQQPIKDAIEELTKSIKGHVKEISQKWPQGCPAQ